MFNKRAQQQENTRRRQPAPTGQGKTFSYRASRVPDHEARQQRLRPEATAVQERNTRTNVLFSFRNIPTIIASIVIIGCVAYSTILITEPRVVVNGDASEQVLLQDAETYRAAARRELNDSVLYRSKMTFNSSAVASSIEKQFPEIKSVRVEIPLIGQKPVLYITSIQPKTILDTPQGSFVLDDRGRAVASATDSAPAGKVRIKDESGVLVSIGDQALPLKNIAFIEELTHQLQEKNISVTEAVLPPGSQSLLVRIEGKPYQVKFSFQGDVMQQAGAFVATYNRLNQTNTNPSEYVDVRVGDRVYFR